MAGKKCFKCGERKPLTAFYAHPNMLDKHLNKCKECTKTDVRGNREKNIEHFRAYDRSRGNRHKKGYAAKYRKKYPVKYKAVNMISNAIRANKLFKEPCELCGCTENIHAHHDDYSKPLNIRWLCAAHHRQWHVKNGNGKNG